MIIDCHTHIFPPQVRETREAFFQKDAGFAAIYGEARAKMAGVEELIASMDDSGVDRSVVCGFPWSDPDRCARHNEYLFESASRYPDRLIVFVTLPVKNQEASLLELERSAERGAEGVGEIGFYDREMTCADLETMRPVLKIMEEERIPLLLHVNETIGHPYPGKGKTDLRRFYELILAFPKLPVVLAHWGGGLPFYELMPEVAKAMGSVCYDTAASPFLYAKEAYRIVCDLVGPDKILFGSDYPLLSPKRYFRDIEDSGLGEGDRKKMLGLNVARLLAQSHR